MDSQVTTSASEKNSIKRVYYTGSDLLQVGYALCYDAATNYTFLGQAAVLNSFGGSSAPSLHDASAGSTALAGTDSMSASDPNIARVIRVIKPTTATLAFFAGVVKDSPQGNLQGPCWVNIYVPQANGQAVPVFTAANAVIDSTGLVPANGSYALSAAAGNQVPVATAMATWDRSSTNGLILARLNPLPVGSAADAITAVAAPVAITTTGANAIPLTSRVVQYTVATTIAAVASLADGVEGQDLSIQVSVADGAGGKLTITPANPGNFATVIAVGVAGAAITSSINLTFRSGKWYLVGVVNNAVVYQRVST